MSITVVIPTIPPRTQLLERSLESVRAQKLQPDRVIVLVDEDGVGAAATRNKALEDVATDFVAFLDDDDVLLPNHLRGLSLTQKRTNADLVYPRFGGINTWVFPPELLGAPFTDEHADHIRTVGNFIPITVLVRTDSIRSVGGFSTPPGASPDNPCEDWGCWIKLLDAGCKFAHHPVVTWVWCGDAPHTSGQAWRQVGDYARA